MTNSKKILGALLFAGLLFVGVMLYALYDEQQAKKKYSEKVWAHRVNSVEKLEYTQDRFSGVELDIVFDSDKAIFDVTHPPVPSIGLTLDNYLKKVNKEAIPYLWLDFKNLNANNRDAALLHLQEVLKNHSIPADRVLVEAQQPEFLKVFESSGYATSYYLPTGLHKLPLEEQNKKIRYIREQLKETGVPAISTAIADYEILAAHFSKFPKYLWSIEKKASPDFFTILIRNKKALEDPSVRAVLFRVNSPSGNR